MNGGCWSKKMVLEFFPLSPVRVNEPPAPVKLKISGLPFGSVFLTMVRWACMSSLLIVQVALWFKASAMLPAFAVAPWQLQALAA